MLDTFMEFYMENYIVASFVMSIITFLMFLLLKAANRYLDIKSYAKKTKRLRKRKFNGITLIDKIRKKRKKNTNSFQKLKGSGKKLVKKYLNYKIVEVPGVTKYSYGKMFKKSKKQIIIIISNETKTLNKIKIKKGLRNMIQVTNKYECLNEMIEFLHLLPDAILDQQDLDVYVGSSDVSIGYLVK